MSKALVTIRADGLALKWAGKYHNHLALVSTDHARIVRFLPFYVLRDQTGFAIHEAGYGVIARHFNSHRAALNCVAFSGLDSIAGYEIVPESFVAETNWAEDMYREWKANRSVVAADLDIENKQEAETYRPTL